MHYNYNSHLQPWNDDDESANVLHLFQGMYGISDEVYLSLPCVLNSAGVGSVVNMSLTSDEVSQLKKSADMLWHIQKDLKDLQRWLTTNGYYSQLRMCDCYDKIYMSGSILPKIFILIS